MSPRSRRYHDDSYDRLPAFGLREDAFDDGLRKSRLTPEEREELKRGRIRVPRQLRAIENYPEDPAAWLADACMTQTEVSLRVAHALIASGIAQSKVLVTLAGNELTRREQPRFPVKRFLVERLGFARHVARANSWEGAYSLRGHAPSLVLLDRDRFDGHVATRLPRQRRLVVFTSRGHTATTRSSGEHKWLRNAIAKAATWDARARDVLAVCVPRSAQFSKLVRLFRDREGVKRLRLHLLTVDRHSSAMGGLDELRSESRT